jgi:hypothetical protein
MSRSYTASHVGDPPGCGLCGFVGFLTGIHLPLCSEVDEGVIASGMPREEIKR